jgi:hypothetical protein
MDFEKAINKAMEVLGISKKKAASELMIFMCGYGTVEDFKDYINWFITHQEEFL